MNNRIFTPAWSGYELLDAGRSKKLERFGKIIVIRPDVNAYFGPEWDFKKWREMAHVEYTENHNGEGSWKFLKKVNQADWYVFYNTVRFKLNTTPYKHLGLFPEQSANWEFMSTLDLKDKNVLNLFCYTGAASVVARSLGANVTQVDSSKSILEWAKLNLQLREITDVRTMNDDAMKFVNRELKRENKYALIIMDPPAWGVGVKGERWKIEELLPEMFKICFELLEPNGTLILNTYSPKVDLDFLTKLGNKFFDSSKLEIAELWTNSSTDKDLFYGNLLRGTK